MNVSVRRLTLDVQASTHAHTNLGCEEELDVHASAQSQPIRFFTFTF